ncbi:hypothetical protein DFQ26_007716, partial [Actinomortierella ambigua]
MFSTDVRLLDARQLGASGRGSTLDQIVKVAAAQELRSFSAFGNQEGGLAPLKTLRLI